MKTEKEQFSRSRTYVSKYAKGCLSERANFLKEEKQKQMYREFKLSFFSKSHMVKVVYKK